MRILYVLLTALLITFFQVPSWALGIGNIDVHSNLGEPLFASVPLVDASNKIDAQCFKLRRQVDGFPSEAVAASIELKSQADGSAKLVIKSYQVFNDPIVELTLTSHCEDQLSRSYTVLLDPPLYESPELASVNVNQVSNGGEVASKSISPTSKLKKDKKRKKKQSGPAQFSRGLASASKNEVASGESTQPPVNASGNQSAQPSLVQNGAPKLIVSGGSSNGAGLALRLETTMSDTPPAETAGQVLELNDLSDDMTAMSKKLEHLESQLATLQQRNQFLEAANKTKVSVQAPQAAVANKADSSDEMPNWWVYVAICLLIIALLVCAEWYKRRKQSLHLDLDGDEEFASASGEFEAEDADPLQLNTNKLSSAGKVGVASLKSDATKAYRPPPDEEVTEVNEGILEQAEVFVAHGRSALAITLLQEHLKDYPKASPAPWLLLLSLLKRENKEADYIAAADECRRYFNFYVPNFLEAVVEDNSSIEDYPNAKDLVVKSWGRPEVIPVLDNLIYNHRNEARQGFERSAYIDILLLRSIAQSQGLSDLSNISEAPVAEEASPKNLGVVEEVLQEAKPEEVVATAAPAESVVPAQVDDEAEHMSFPPLEADLSGDPLGISSAEDNSLDFNLDWPVETVEPDHILDAAEAMTVTEVTEAENFTITTDVDDEINKTKPSDKSKPLDFDV